MPELPELELIKKILNREIIGKEIEIPVFTKPYILKGIFPGYEKAFPSRIEKIERRGKFLLFQLKSSLRIVIHPMKSGRIKISPEKNRVGKFTACYLKLNDGRVIEIVEYGKEKMAKIYIVKDSSNIPGFRNIGIDPFDSNFTTNYLKELLTKKRKNLKLFLKDQKKISGIGNAYSDEILWEAQLSPFASSDLLNDTEIANFYCSIKKVLRNGIKEIEKRTKGKIVMKEPREFMQVYERKGEPCPRFEVK
ncbi:hypothetical protein KAX75_10150 [candidate division WOR-3 bacterium]|nr:hypothetical protein [candidate division WOR-3 bacterium]